MAEIKISELSVGDWIATESAQLAIEGNDIATAFVDKVKKPIQIVSVLGDERLVFGRIEELDGFTSIYLKAEHIEPIPLTAEILEKNGFEEGKRYDGWDTRVFSKDMASVSMPSKDKWCRIRVYSEDGFYELSSAIVSYVHQLQHALRLAGIEKGIEV